eukprot:GHVN01000806.1.p4 GENE.GHVN01000806.1~~GHVN01000806.1.p4  ORF type:complete len:205 (-),score=36.50 GHVN01000806.1:371-985(-)
MPGEHGPGCGCKHETELVGSEFLLPYIEKEAIRGMNEQIQGSAKTIFKVYEDRLTDHHCSSVEDDTELIIHIPFSSPCKISSMHLIGGEGGRCPKDVKLFSNTPDLDFEGAQSSKPVQSVELLEDYCGAIEYPLKVTQLQNVTTLTLYFNDTHGSSPNQLFYVGLRGEGSSFKREAVVTVYESQAQRSDHQVKDEHQPTLGQGF